MFIKIKDEQTKPSLTEIAEEEYIKSRSKAAKKTEQFVLNTTEDITKHDNISKKVANQ